MQSRSITCVCVTGFGKTVLLAQNFNLFCSSKSYIYTISRNTKYLIDGLICFLRWLFSESIKPRGYISGPMPPLKGINRTARGAILVLTAVLAYPVDWASLCHILKAQHCSFCQNSCFNTPWAHLLEAINDIAGVEKPALLKYAEMIINCWKCSDKHYQ